MKETKEKQYNYCMDFLKGIACILVVFIHVKFPGNFGLAVQSIAHFAVPFFFMVSGYYFYCEDYLGIVRCGKKIWHIFKIVFFAYLFYIIVALIYNHLFGGAWRFDFSFSHILQVALYGVPSNVPGELWFMIALLEVYIIYFFVDLLHAKRLAYWVAAFTFLAMIMLAQVFWLYYGYKLYFGIYRNAWIEGFSFFTLGYYLHDKQDKLTLSNKTLLIIIAISAVLSVVERFLCGVSFALHLSTYVLVTSLFIYAIINPERYEGIMQCIGKRYSMYVYILHMFWIILIDRLVRTRGLEGNMLMMWFRPLIVLVLVMLMSMGCYTLFNRIKNIKPRKLNDIK